MSLFAKVRQNATPQSLLLAATILNQPQGSTIDCHLLPIHRQKQMKPNAAEDAYTVAVKLFTLVRSGKTPTRAMI